MFKIVVNKRNYLIVIQYVWTTSEDPYLEGDDYALRITTIVTGLYS